MALELALIEFNKGGNVRLLGRTTDPALVEPVRKQIVDQQIEALKALGFGDDDDPSDIGGLAA